MRTGRLVLGCGLAVLWLGGERPGAASPRPTGAASRVLLHVSPCLAKVLDESEVARLVAIELGPGRPSGSAAGSTPTPTPLHAQLDCSDGSPQLADLTVEDRGTGRALLRTVDLSAQAQPLYARLIALSLAELVHAVASERWEEPQPTAPPPVAVAAPPPPVRPPVAALTPSPSEPRAATPGGLYAQGGFALLVPLAGPGAPLHVGAGLRVGGDHRYHLGWDFDAQVLTARRRTALGDLTSDLLSSRAALQAHLAWPRLLLRGGLGLRVGAVRLAGSPSDGTATTAREAWAPFGGPLISFGLAFVPQSLRRLRADLTTEAGYLLWSATARVDTQPSLAIAGPWLGLSLSLGWGQTRPIKPPPTDR